MPPKNSGGSTKFPGGHKVIHRTAQTAFVRVVTPRDTLQTIDMIGCIVTGFMKKMQYNTLNIKSVAKQVWFYFLRGTTRPGYAGTITNLQIVPYLNQATQKNTCQKKSRNQ